MAPCSIDTIVLITYVLCIPLFAGILYVQTNLERTTFNCFDSFLLVGLTCIPVVGFIILLTVLIVTYYNNRDELEYNKQQKKSR